MLKLLIVDDEILVRTGLRSTIKWGEIGFEIVGEADNGEKALEFCRRYKPDIVITDIRMPKMDGITLMKNVKQELPDTKFIVLSCYNEIDIVREAMQFYGALDYIPKLSMLPDDLINTMKNVKKIIEGERYKENEVLELKHRTSDALSDENLVFNDLIDKKVFLNEDFKNRVKKLELNIDMNKKYLILIGQIDHLNNLVKNTNQIKFSLLKMIKEKLKEHELSGSSFYRTDNEIGIIINIDNINFKKVIDGLCQDIINKSRLERSITLSFGISEIHDGFSEFNKAYNKAITALAFKLYSGQGSINYYTDYEKLNCNNYFGNFEEKNFREYVENCEETKAFTIVEELIEKIKLDGMVSPEKVYDQLQEIIYTLSSVIKQYNGNIHDLKNEEGKEICKEIKQCKTMDELQDWFRDFLSYCFEYYGNLKKQKFGIDISRVLEFINLHYSEDIKLSNIANYVALNETYLSHLFKKATSYNFTEYLNIVRINKAKEYFKDKNLNVYMVAEKVGYSNESYFSKVFKQITGLTPKEYKNQK